MILFCCASELGPPEDLSAIEVILYYYYSVAYTSANFLSRVFALISLTFTNGLTYVLCKFYYNLG